ncbi:MAG: MFS transporter [Thalassospira sp.]|uniref:MFS transporter n=1 Tax=Thalassospira sp. TaxID=1912094 RepID=UPI0032EE2DCA
MKDDVTNDLGEGGNKHHGSVIAILDRYPVLVLGLLLVGAFTSSCAVPLAGLYVVEGLGQSPWKLSMVAIVQVCVTLITNRAFGRAIDRGVPVKILLVTSIVCFGTGMLILGVFQIYWVYLGIVSILLGIGSGALSVMYSFGRLFAEQTDRDVVKFNGFLRMQTSLGWMVGPAAALSFYGVFGFAATYYGIAGLSLIWFAACLLIVPHAFKTHHPNSLKVGQRIPFNFGLLQACIPVFFIGAANVVFVSAMPLYFSTEMGLIASSAGFALSVKCLIEVVAIYFCASLIKRVGERKGMLIASVLAAVFFGLIYHASSLEDVLLLAVLDGIYYGIFAGISMTFVQNFAPDQPGVATSYYVSTLFVGGLIGNLLTGVVASIFDFQTTVLLACGFALVGGVVLMGMGDARPDERVRDAS